MKKAVVAMLGARMHYAVPKILNQSGLLEFFYTDSFIGNKPLIAWLIKGLHSIIPKKFLEQWLDRRCEGLNSERVEGFEWLGIRYALRRRWAKGPAEESVIFRDTAKRFNSKIIDRGLGDAEIVFGLNGAALELFEAAKRHNRHCVLEQTSYPMALDKRLMSEEQERRRAWPRYFTNWTMPLAMDGREEIEWKLADTIVAGSEFVRSGLISMGVEARKIHVIPYGIEPARFDFARRSKEQSRKSGAPVKVLFAGEVGLRKGAPDFLEAVSCLDKTKVEIRMAGRISLNDDIVTQFTDKVNFLGHLPREQMSAMFAWADVFVLPSISEGSAGVIYEAIMSDCPVITTPNAGSIITDGVDGFIVPIRSPKAIAAALQLYIDEPSLINSHREALQLTRQWADVKRYHRDLESLIRSL